MFKRINSNWTVTCSDNVYFNMGDARKLMNLTLAHGTEAKVCYYQESDNEALSYEFIIDLDYKKEL